MEVAQPFELNPWRRAAVIAALVATLELVLLLVAGMALFGSTVVHRAQQTALTTAHHTTKAPPPVPTHPLLPRDQTSVLVLNGNGQAGAASTAAATLRAHGYEIGSVGNAPRTDYPTTIVMYRPGYRAEGERLGRDLHLQEVGPLDGLHPNDLMGAHLALILGN